MNSSLVNLRILLFSPTAGDKDKIWGVGLAENDPLILDRTNWKGLNLLGQAITEARNIIIQAPVKEQDQTIQESIDAYFSKLHALTQKDIEAENKS